MLAFNLKKEVTSTMVFSPKMTTNGIFSIPSTISSRRLPKRISVTAGESVALLRKQKSKIFQRISTFSKKSSKTEKKRLFMFSPMVKSLCRSPVKRPITRFMDILPACWSTAALSKIGIMTMKITPSACACRRPKKTV